MTLTGPGGVGKTSLALQVAGDLSRAPGAPGSSGARGPFPDGVWLVELAALTDPALLPQAVATVVEVRERPGRPIEEVLLERLAGRGLLLVLDNCEHLLDACARLLDALLRGCPELRVLATSREALRISGEVAWPVPALAVPDLGAALTPQAVLAYPAARLFVERARAVEPAYAVSDAGAHALARLCGRLEGNALAIELAAARAPVLSPEQILDRLGDGLRLLSQGSRSAPARQQSLRATLDWSHDLLSARERVLFRRLSVFAGGWTLEAAEAVCAGGAAGAAEDGLPQDEVLDVLGGLVAKSLVQVEVRGGQPRTAPLSGSLAVLHPARSRSLFCTPSPVTRYAATRLVASTGVGPPSSLDFGGGPKLARPGRGPRYRLLETVRQYALQRLEGGADGAAVRRRHAACFLALAEQAEPHLRRAEAGAWLDRLQADHDNIRAALGWGEEAQETGEGAVDFPPRLAGALWMFWWQRGHFAEGRRWLEAALRHPPGLPSGACCPPPRSAPRSAPRFATTPLRPPAPGSAPPARVKALFGAASLAMYQDDYARAEALWQDLLALGRDSGDEATVAWALGRLGYAAHVGGDYQRAAALCAESLALSRRLGDGEALALALMSAGHLAFAQGEMQQAEAAYAEGASLDRVSGTAYRLQYWLAMLGAVATERGQLARATTLCGEALALARQRGDKWAIEQILRGLMRIARRRGDHRRAASLAREHFALVREVGSRSRVVDDLEALAWVARVQGQLPRAARLLGAAGALRDAVGRPVPPRQRSEYSADLATLRAALGGTAFSAAWEEGRALSAEGNLAAALDDGAPVDGAPAAGALGQRPPAAPEAPRRVAPAGRLPPDALTRREREVTALVAQGFTNREIARELVITEGTVAVHVEHILAKLQFRSRTQVAAWAVRCGLPDLDAER